MRRNPTYLKWTRAEMDILETAWKEGGLKAALAALPHRTPGSLRGKANALDVHMPTRKPYEKTREADWEWIDAALRRAYRDGRPDLVQLSLQLKKPRPVLKSRAAALGMARPTHKNGREWTPEETKILETGLDLGHAIRTIHKHLQKAGFKRSLAAVATRVCVVGMRWNRGFLSPGEVAGALGIDTKNVNKWLSSGRLKAKRATGPSSTRDVEDHRLLWQIQPADVRAFMLRHPELWDHRKMQQSVLLDLLCQTDFNAKSRQESA